MSNSSHSTNNTSNPKLTAQQQRVLFEKATEAPFTGTLLHNQDQGTYGCANCGQQIFSSKDKFDSGTGWPSFSDVTDQGKVKLIKDNSHGMTRTEVVCAHCGGHLGHLFDDGPSPTKKRYCINSCSLEFGKKG